MKPGLMVLEAKRYEVIVCSANDLLRDIAAKMVHDDISSVVVTTPEGGLAGIITRIDLLRAYTEHANWQQFPVSQYMSTQVVTVTSQTLLHDVVPLLVERRIHRVVVVEENHGRASPVAVLSASDLLYHMLRPC